MRKTVAVLAGMALIGGAAGAALVSPVKQLAGRYSQSFQNGTVDGDRYTSENIVEIVPVDADHAYLRFELAFYNGHSCSLAGVARAEGDALVYREPPAIAYSDKACVLTVRRAGDTLGWNDDGTCRAYCGARGGFVDGTAPWRSRRAIRYLPRLKASPEYAGALHEWRTGTRLDP